MKLLANNKKAYHEYEILEKLEAGLVLKGTEVKSIKAGKVNIREAYIEVRDFEMFILGMHVSPYEQGNIHNVDPLRPKKLLLRQREIVNWYDKVKQQGVTIVPLRVYTNNSGLVKMEIGLARGKKIYDKRESLRERDDRRQIDRALKQIRG